MDDEDRIELNKAARRKVKFFGITGESAIALFGVAVFCMILSSLGVPNNVLIALAVSLMLTTAYLVKDGTGDIMARFRTPVQYTRGFWTYQSPLKPKKSQSKRK